MVRVLLLSLHERTFTMGFVSRHCHQQFHPSTPIPRKVQGDRIHPILLVLRSPSDSPQHQREQRHRMADLVVSSLDVGCDSSVHVERYSDNRKGCLLHSYLSLFGLAHLCHPGFHFGRVRGWFEILLCTAMGKTSRSWGKILSFIVTFVHHGGKFTFRVCFWL